MASALHTIQMLGLAGVASYALGRMAVRSGLLIYYRYAIVATPRSAMPAMPPGFQVRALKAEELAPHIIDAPARLQQDRFAQGMTCLGAFNKNGALVGVTWLAPGGMVEDDVNVRFAVPEGSCWDTGLWIVPRYRLSRAFVALWAGTAEWMAAQGLDHSYSRIADYNLPSILSHRRMGAVTLGHHSFIKIGRWQYSSSTRPRFVRQSGAPAALLPVGPLPRARQAT